MPRTFQPDQAGLLQEALEGQPMLTAFPNPFTDQTTIRFILHEDADVDVGLFDIHGKRIRTIYAGSVIHGDINDFEIRQDQLPAGVYLVRLYASGIPDVLHRQLIIR